MEEYKKVVVMKLGKTLNGLFYPKKEKWKFPKECPVSVDFDEDKLVGFARNFRQVKDTIVCDIIFGCSIKDTIMPKVTHITENIKGKSIATKIKLTDLGLMNNPSDKTLQGNVNKKIAK